MIATIKWCLAFVFVITFFGFACDSVYAQQCETLTDPTDCTVLDGARARLVSARELLLEEYSKSGAFSESTIACFISAANYIAVCEKASTCQSAQTSLSVSLSRSLGAGWTEATYLELTGNAGSCVFVLANLAQSTEVLAPNGTRVLTSIRPSRGEENGHRLYMIGERYACTRADGRSAERGTTFSHKGVQVIDWTEERKVSAHWGKRLSPMPKGGDPKLTPIDADHLRVVWDNGAFVELDYKGALSGSNFLDRSMFEPVVCQTLIHDDRKHFYPRVRLLEGTTLVREEPGFIKQ